MKTVSIPKLLMIISLFTIVTMSSSCTKQSGCTDRDAENYDAEAEDHCCCEFKGQVVLWYGQYTSSQLLNDGAVSLTYYVNGDVVGSSSASVYWTGAPVCGQNGSVTVSKDLGTVKNKSYSFQVKDQTGYVYWEGVLNFTANTCEKMELTW